MKLEQQSGIIFADISRLQELAGTQELTTSEYNKIIRRFHSFSSRFVELQKRVTGHIAYADARGDSLLIVTGGKDLDTTAAHTAMMAVGLKQSWRQSELAQELGRLSSIMEGPGVDLSIGVHMGALKFERNPFSGKITPEGIAISKAKWIQQLAQCHAPGSLMLASLDIKDASDAANLGITFSGHHLELSEPEKALFGKKRALLDHIYLYPVLSYPQTPAA